MNLSVVLICRNQDWNIRRLITSVLRECGAVRECEIVVVDSASTDNTIALASQLPVTVLRLGTEQKLTAAAARHVGFLHTSGELILFLDGDMELRAGWLAEALKLLLRKDDVAAITGGVEDVLPSLAETTFEDHVENAPTGHVTVPFCGGAGMYRRCVLEEVGSFNPHLYSDEEPDLCLRIRRAGYSIVKLERAMVFHYSETNDSFIGLVNRWRRNLFFGMGQNLRYKLSTELFWPYVIERGFAFAPVIAILPGVVALIVWPVTGNATWFAAWVVIVATVIACYAVRNRSVYRTFVSLFKRLLVVAGTVRGFLMPALSTDAYCTNVEVASSPGSNARRANEQVTRGR